MTNLAAILDNHQPFCSTSDVGEFQGRNGELDDTTERELLTLSEAADRLRKSEAQLRWMLHKGAAPRSALIGGRRMFRASDVAAYIEAAFDASERTVTGAVA